jgi:predicted amidohydrolase
MIIALASPCIASTLHEGLDKIKRFLSEASAQGAEIVCFPEAYLPGLRGQDFEVLAFDQTQQERTLQAVSQWARACVNYALRFQESATSLIAPSGQCQAYLPYGQEGVLVQTIKVEEATGLLAARYASARYQEFRLE